MRELGQRLSLVSTSVKLHGAERDLRKFRPGALPLPLSAFLGGPDFLWLSAPSVRNGLHLGVP
jgi:hypothetical protein